MDFCNHISRWPPHNNSITNSKDKSQINHKLNDDGWRVNVFNFYFFFHVQRLVGGFDLGE